MVKTCAEIVNELVVASETGKDVNLNGLKNRISRRNKLQNQPKLVDIIAAIPEQHKAALLPKLKAKPVRTASGVSNGIVDNKKKQRDKFLTESNGRLRLLLSCASLIDALTLQWLEISACKCLREILTKITETDGDLNRYCPGGPDSDFEYSTQSYTGYEPTSMRAIRARYDPLEQARGRVEQLRSLGHSVDKVEYILMGGTFMSMPEDYRNWFIANLHDALSGHSSNDVDEAVRYV